MDAAISQQHLLDGITDPYDTDVLCGRGGAALRHPGNQTYRRLVNLNKGLYTTCLKTEKLKISRSIVAAIREQKGRFLEKNNETGTWYDIGDKKAIEKTSQALREGQPKLRQKIQEMGGGTTSAATVMEQQYGHSGIFPEQVGMMGAASGDNLMPPPSTVTSQLNQNSLHSTMHSMDTSGRTNMDPYLLSGHSNDMMLNSNHSNFSSDISAYGSSMHGGMPMEAFMRLAQNMGNNNNNGFTNNQMQGNTMHSLSSNYSSSLEPYSVGGGTDNNLIIGNSDHSTNSGVNFQQQKSAKYTSLLDSGFMSAAAPIASGSLGPGPSNRPAGQSDFDRRRVFAKMKYDRAPSTHARRSHHKEDGMPDIHMVESQLSILSNLSLDSKPAPEKAPRPARRSHQPIIENEIAKIVDHHSNFDHHFGGSRRSIMSGISRMSEGDRSAMDHSIFSDLSRKIGNVSTRSIAMSEFSAIELAEKDDMTVGSSPRKVQATGIDPF